MVLWSVLGALAALAAAWLAARATRLRRRGEWLKAAIPQSIDGALSELERGLLPEPGVYSGRLGADGEVATPAGVVCAFYEARVRVPGGTASRERGAARRVWIRGERAHAAIEFSAHSAHAPAEEKRVVVADGDGPSGAVALADAGGAALSAPGAVEATSEERVGRIGQSCFVLGRIEPGPSGGYVVRGIAGGAATVITGVSHAALARAWLLRSWVLFGGAAAMAIASAWLLAK